MTTIQKILTALFPFIDRPHKNSVFIQDTWLERITKPTYIKDYLWHGEVNYGVEKK